MNLVLWSDNRGLDPVDTYSSDLVYVAPNIYESLYQYAYLSDPPKVEPLLADGFPRLSSDRLTATIRIKPGIVFADDPCFKATDGHGREVTAEDFIYSFKRVANPKLDSSGWWILDGRVRGINDFHEKLQKATGDDFSKAWNQPIEGLQAVDAHTLRIVLTKPTPQLAALLTLGSTAVVPHEAVEAYADADGRMMEHAVGTGPYVLALLQPRQEILLRKNPTYHEELYPHDASPSLRDAYHLASAGRRLPLANEIHYKVFREEWSNWLEFLKGDVDHIAIPRDAFNQVIRSDQSSSLTPEMAASGVRLFVTDSVTTTYIAINMRDPLLGKNKLLRQALSSAVDRDAWNRYFENGQARTMINFLPVGVEGRATEPHLKYDYNLSRAKTLLAEAGYPNGNGLPPIDLAMGMPGTTQRQLGEFFTRQFAQIGVQVETSFDDPSRSHQRILEGNFQLLATGWSMDYLDAENNYMILYGPNASPGPNIPFFANPAFDALFPQMAVETPGPDRTAKIQALEAIVQEETPVIMGLYPRWQSLTQPWVKNYRYHDLIFNGAKYLDVDAH